METATADFTKNTFIIYFDHNCRTAFFQNTSLRSKRVGMNLTHHTVSSTFLTLKCHSVFFFFDKKRKKNWAQVNDLKNINRKAISKKELIA